MTSSHPARTAPGRSRIGGIGAFGVVVVVVAAAAAAVGSQLPAFSSSTASSSSRDASPIAVGRGGHRRARAGRDGALGAADGVLPYGTTVFDDALAGVAKLDPALLVAVRQAATDAARDGVEVVVDSGWRSPAYQEQLLREAVLRYGSEAKAARWVATPSTSAHVRGDAVDVGPSAAAWLSQHGAAYGLCQIYANEPWHYELRPQAAAHGCPPTYSNPTHDPRMQQ